MNGSNKFPIHTKMQTASYISSTVPTDPLPQVRLNLSRRACELRFARRRLMLDVREFGIDKRAGLARDYPGHLATPPARELIHARVSSFPFAGCACSFFHCAYWRARSSAFGRKNHDVALTGFVDRFGAPIRRVDLLLDDFVGEARQGCWILQSLPLRLLLPPPR